jgi:hypothetical protein
MNVVKPSSLAPRAGRVELETAYSPLRPRKDEAVSNTYEG